MTENQARHIIALLVTFVAVIIYVIAYFSGVHGWWLTIVTLGALYALAYKLIEV